MRRAILFSAAVVATLSVASSATVGKLFLMSEAAKTDGAVCLDGTPPGYYFAPGSGSGASKWLIYHEGGGWCESFQDCFSRSNSDLGSSKAYPATADLDNGGGYFSSDSTANPQLYNWNKVYMKYCDGASYSGSNSNTTVVNGKQLFFRGKHILDAFINDLLTNRGLNTATDAVITGCSAGGLATYLHGDKWAAALPAGVKVVTMPDSGFFLDYEGLPPGVLPHPSPAPLRFRASNLKMSDIGPGVYQNDMKWVFQNQNVTSGVHQGCIAARPEQDHWKCMFAEHTAPFIQTPTFPLQSEYDSWQIGNVLFVSNNIQLIQQMGQNITIRLQKNLLMKPQHGVFLDSCEHHCGEWGSIMINNMTQPQAFQAWYEKTTATREWIQGQAYPCKACCSA